LELLHWGRRPEQGNVLCGEDHDRLRLRTVSLRIMQR
jgi:hypothetical protein